MTVLDDRMRLRQLLAGFQATQAIHVAACLGLPNLMAGAPRTSDELASLTGSNATALRRLAFALVALGVLRKDGQDRFGLTPMGDLLRCDVPGSQSHRALLMGRPYFWQAWGAFSHSVETGRTAFDHVHGVDGWTWRDAHPEDGALFDAAMAADAGWMAGALIEACDVSRFRHIVDVGGGDGSLLGRILAGHPSLRGTLFEQPRVVADAQRSSALAALGGRCAFVAGSFLESVPAGGDAYLLKWILHNWSDDDCLRILRSCREAMVAEGRLLIIEQITDPACPDIAGTLMDLNMMVMNGGRERTEPEFAGLLDAAGFRMDRLTKGVAGLSVLEARPA